MNLYAYCGNNPVVYYDPSGYMCESKISGYVSGEGKVEANGITVTDEVIRDSMKDAPLQTQQGGVSKPVIQNYVDRINAGETNMPPIKVDGNIIVDGNHRYIASRITGVDVEVKPWSGGKPENVVNWQDIILDDFDWGNR